MKKKDHLTTLPTEITPLICAFLSLAEVVGYSLSCKALNAVVTQEFIKQKIKEEFAEFLRDDKELDAYQGQDLTTLWLVLNYHKQATQIVHQNKTPYYSQLVYPLIQAFLARQKKPVDAFPWACYILGNLMRVDDKAGAYRYFEKAINAKPSLHLARLVIAVDYPDKVKELFAEDMKEIKPLALVAFTRKDFFESYLRTTNSRHYARRFASIFKPNTPEYKEILEASYEYADIVRPDQLSSHPQIKKWMQQMKDAKDPVVISDMAGGLLKFFVHRLHMELKPDEKAEVEENIDLCKRNGGFFERGGTTHSETLMPFTEEKVYVKPGGLGAFHVKLAQFYYSESRSIEALDSSWQGVRLGYPAAIIQLNLLWHEYKLDEIATVDASVAFPARATVELSKGIFVAHQVLSWAIDIRSTGYKQVISGCQDFARKRLTLLAGAAHPYSRAVAETALGLLACQNSFTAETCVPGDHKKAEAHFKKARQANPAAFEGYLTFIREQNYLLFPEVRECLQNYKQKITTPALADNKQHLLVGSSPTMATKTAIEHAIKAWLDREADAGRPIQWELSADSLGTYVQMIKRVFNEKTKQWLQDKLKGFNIEFVTVDQGPGADPKYRLIIRDIDPASFQSTLLSAAPGL